MNELPVFMSYRQVDGIDLARWLHNSLHGRSIFMETRSTSLAIPATLSVFFDRALFAVPDWHELHSRELDRASALVVICTPGAMHEFVGDDWLYREIRWWIEHRSTIAPILVTPNGPRWIPEVISKQWPNAQHILADRQAWNVLPPEERALVGETNILSILGGIRISASKRCWNTGQMRSNLVERGDNEGGKINLPELYTWEKDKRFHYINCNDNYARAAGYDSPGAMLGKTDDDMPWSTLADYFRAGDQQVISGTASRRHVTEKEIMVDGVADILVTENQLVDRRGECIGVTGYFLDITGSHLVPKPTPTDDGKGLNLGKEFGNERLSQVEVDILKGMLKAHSAANIARSLFLKRKKVDALIQSIKRKLQCITDGDVIAVAMRSGLPLFLFGPKVIGPEVTR